MDCLSPFAKQILIAASPQLAAISVGGVVGYPNVLLEQFRGNESSIQLDLNTASWIGSTHGIAGLPSIFMPAFMQWRGRKPAFIISSFIIIIGWFITFLAESTSSILIAEAFHGLGTNSMIIVSFFTISEMVDPKFRLISMSFYCINQTLGIALVGIMGRYLHWKTVGYIMSVPMFVSISIALFWPESPFWLALKGEFEKCEIAFLWLRGNGVKARKELNELINSQKPSTKTIAWKEYFKKVTRKDFLVPSFQTFVCLCTFYCSGTLVLIIYSMDMIREATESEFAAFYGMISIDIILYIGCLTNAVLIKFFNNKTVFLCSSFGSTVCLFLASLVSYMQSVEVLSSDSLWVLYFLLAFMVVDSLGIATMTFTIAAEIMPVKYRDIGGAVYVILTCLLHFFSLKVSPYLFLYLGLSGTFLGFALNATFCSLYIWKFVPETKNRRLQEIENYYSIGFYDGTFNYEENEMLRSNF